MSEKVSQIFAFACDHPDYWELMRQSDEPPEVAELDEHRRAAFNAARMEARRSYRALLAAVYAELKEKVKGTAMHANFPTRINEPSYAKAAFKFSVFRDQGTPSDVCISIQQGAGSRVGALCSIKTAARYESALSESFESAVAKGRLQRSDQWLYVEEPIKVDEPLAAIASRLVAVFWPGMQAYSLRPIPEAGAQVLEADEE